MRLHNLTTAVTEKIRGGDIKLLRGVLLEELDITKNELIDLPLDKKERASGHASALRLILKVLG